MDEVEAVDLLGSSPADSEPYFVGVDAVVHTAYYGPNSSHPLDQYEGKRRNVDMMQWVYQMALDKVYDG